MNLYQSGVFSYEQQKLTLGNSGKKGHLGEGHEIAKKNRHLEPNSEMTGKPSLSPEQPSRSFFMASRIPTFLTREPMLFENSGIGYTTAPQPRQSRAP